MTREYWRGWRHKSTATPDWLRDALRWVGIEHGRTAEYQRLLVEFSQGHRSNEHFFSYYESTEILSIFDSWRDRSNDFPGIQDKISFVFKKGTILSEDESASANSNRPRNDAFVYALAGKLLHIDEIHILSVDGITNKDGASVHVGHDSAADIVFSFRENLIRVECKRPMSEATLYKNVEEAFHQLIDSLSKPIWGIIAIDASRLLRKAGEYLEVSSLEAGSKFLSKELEKLLLPIAKQYDHEMVLGLIGFSRVPLVGKAKSRILKQDGTPFVLENLSATAMSYLCIKNPKSPQGDLVHELQRLFSQTTHDIPQDAVPIT
jgi:hypothetical protein